jgi:hypothetical protein
LHALCRGEGGGNYVGLIIRLEVGFDVRLFLEIGHMNRSGGGGGSLECVRHRKRDVLAVIANDIVFEGRATLVDDAFEPLPLD